MNIRQGILYEKAGTLTTTVYLATDKATLTELLNIDSKYLRNVHGQKICVVGNVKIKTTFMETVADQHCWQQEKTRQNKFQFLNI